MPYTCNGSAASLAPFRQTWIDYIMGTDLRGVPIIGGFRDCRLEFESCTYASYNQWAQFANIGTSVVSANVLNLDGTSFTAFSGVYFKQTERPMFESGNVGAWTLFITRCNFSGA